MTHKQVIIRRFALKNIQYNTIKIYIEYTTNERKLIEFKINIKISASLILLCFYNQVK